MDTILNSKMKNMLSKNNTDVKSFLDSATPEKLDFYEIAGKLLSYNNDMGIIFDYTDDVHLSLITEKLVEYKDSEFVKRLKSVEYPTDLIQLKDMIPNEEIFEKYVLTVIEQFERKS